PEGQQIRAKASEGHNDQDLGPLWPALLALGTRGSSRRRPSVPKGHNDCGPRAYRAIRLPSSPLPISRVAHTVTRYARVGHTAGLALTVWATRSEQELSPGGHRDGPGVATGTWVRS